jgi:hypothetical protein
MPYKNPNYCISEKYFAQKEQDALAAKYNMMNGMFRVLAEVAANSEANYEDAMANGEAAANESNAGTDSIIGIDVSL